MKIRIAYAVLPTLLLAAAIPAYAHGSMKPQHGGIVKMSGEIMVELVSTPKGLSFYVTEEDEPRAASGFNGTVTITPAGGSKTSHAMVAQQGNLFTVAGAKAPKGAKVVVSLTEKSSGAKTFVTFQS
jgi:hypothetical protein